MVDYDYKYEKYKSKYRRLSLKSLNEYLDGVRFIDSHNADRTEVIKSILMKSLIQQFKKNDWDDIQKLIENEISKLHEVFTQPKCSSATSEKWIECSKSCQSQISHLISIEINSTAYILRTLSKSIISSKSTLIFQVPNPKVLTGQWHHDSSMIKLHQYGNQTMCNRCPHGRLIMGFGPSASGKTTWAKKIIALFREVNRSFPDSFISIDGGTYRETCKIYQMAKDTIKSRCFAGFSNLVLSSYSPTKKSLFNSTIVKKKFISYLRNQSNHITINLYVPETLGGCSMVGKTCEKVYDPYIKVTQDKTMIGLLIWQHKTGEQCNFDSSRQCVGCIKSGKDREKNEGKKYSSSAWERSMENGMLAIKHARGGAYKIHNTGGKKYSGGFCVSTIEDYTVYSRGSRVSLQIKNKEREYGYVYERK